MTSRLEKSTNATASDAAAQARSTHTENASVIPSNGAGIPENWKRWMRYESGRLRYYLSRNLNPNDLTGPIFTRGFAGVGSVLLIPLLVAVFGADLVSSEFAEGTITLLLTRPVDRW